MKSIFPLLGDALLLITAVTAASPALDKRNQPACKQFDISVTAHAKNKLIYSPTDDLSTVAGVTSFLSSTAGIFSQLFSEIDQGGTFPISATYCPPSPHASAPSARANHVQFLLHGIPYDKTYWQGHNLPGPGVEEKYSWTAHMTGQGYPVLMITNLGGQNSSVHPNPILTVQQPLEAEIVHQIVKKLRAGSIGQGVPKASKIIWGSHSYASALGNYVMTHYPNDFDAALLTGYTYTLANAVPGVLLANLEPAVLYDSKRYGHLSPGYLTFGSRHGKRESYYAANGDFDPAVEEFDFNHEGITTIGEIATFFAGMNKAKDFKGDILTITGEQDALFCGLGSRTIQIPSCGEGKDSLPAKTAEFFPKANYHYYIAPGTSHATNLHHSSQAIFKHAATFLQANGY